MLKSPRVHPSAPFGTVLGIAPGNVEVYSSDYATVDESAFPNRQAYRSYCDGIFMGYKWQCVELARRWLYVNRGYVFDDIAMAYDIFRLTSVKRTDDGRRLPLKSFRNGCKRPPEVGCLLIWDEGGEFHVTGHVAVVTEVLPDRVRFVEQNVEDSIWRKGENFSRELNIVRTEDGGYCLNCSFDDATILGWVIQTDDDTHAEEIIEPDKRLFNLQIAELKDAPKNGGDWLDRAQPDEAAYCEMMGGATLTCAEEEFYKYFRLSATAERELKRATNELHAMFMHATNYVLGDDSVLERFNIPTVLLPRIRQSWNNRRNEIITGRLDFAVSERGIKLYEYNADSASCHMETGKVQGLWAQAFGCSDGDCAGELLHERMIEAWKNSAAHDQTVHIMQDRDLEETYHALYMRTALEKAGIRTKIVKGLSSLGWNEKGQVVDRDGERILWVWKTWAWETALDDIRDQCAEMDERLALHKTIDKSVEKPRLADVLLTEDVMVFEPLWTLIPSNKAILPVLWMLYPDHPYLLDSQFELTDKLRANGYVSKPIVGRCGANISLFDTDNNLLKETSGNFEDRDQIFQELWKLPKIDGKNVQISTFTAEGRYAGMCTRVDRSLIITSKSDVYPLRMCEDEGFL